MSETNLPKLEVADIIQALDGVTNSKVDTTGTTKPLLECVTSGVLRGAAVVLGTDGSEVRDTQSYVGLIKKLIANDIVVLAIGYPVSVANDAGLLAPEAKDLCGAGLKRVCELAGIPPVLPLGGLENIQNVVTIATALCNDSGLTVPQLPIAGCDPAGVTAQAVELGNTFVGLGVDTFIGIMPYEGSLEDVVAASGLKDGAEAKHTVSADLDELADALIADIEKKRLALGSPTLFDLVFSGNDDVYGLAENAINDAIAKYGEDKAVAFPDTAYSLPCYYAVTGVKVGSLKELKEALGVVKTLMTREQRLNDAFNSGVATALCAEFIEVLKYIDGATPYEEPCYGHLSDATIRELGVPLVTGDIPGVAVLLGAAPSPEEAVALVKSYQAQGILVTLTGEIIGQLKEAGFKTGANVRVIPLGEDLTSVIHVVSVAIRAALIFGNIKPGDVAGLIDYTMNRVPAFVNAFGPLTGPVVACGAGAICLGFPVITNQDVFRVPKSLVVQEDVSKFNATSLEARNIKIKITDIDIPVAFASAFEGEIVRRGDMQVEFDGSRVDCFELVQSRELSEVEDHKIEIIGPDLDTFEQGSKQSIGYIVEVAGKSMQPDFEPVFERKFHSYLNCVEGVMHTGQRDMIRIRISKDTFNAGFRLKDIGEVLYARTMNEFSAVVDRCQVTIYTDPEKCGQLRREVAVPAYNKRDERLTNLTDEGVDVYYSCIMCQAFSPSHVCVITPERLGLCGAVSWLDAKATNELDPEGPCQVITKEKEIDPRIGEYEDVNEAVHKFSQGALDEVSLYSIIEKPMTSCGCFECICGIEPVSNGVCIANREYAGMTPIGMTFSELASMTGGGVQTPGFMGHGKQFIASKKFMKAEGGVARIVWMPKDLKEQVADRLNATAKELYGIDNFSDMIADETVTEDDPEALLAFLTEKNHPALQMEPMM